MSKFSGKCDVYDDFIEIQGLTDESDWSKIKIYHKDQLLDIKSVKDLLPYSAHLISMEYRHNGECTAHISDISFVDREEQEMLYIYLEDAKREYRRCRRKKIEFVPEEAAKKLAWMNSKKLVLEICKRVKEHPCKTDMTGIKYDSPCHNMQRELLRDEMVKYGYTAEQADKWVYEGVKTW